MKLLNISQVNWVRDLQLISLFYLTSLVRFRILIYYVSNTRTGVDSPVLKTYSIDVFDIVSFHI